MIFSDMLIFLSIMMSISRALEKIPYHARISYNGKWKYIGSFKTATEAGKHYDACARLFASKFKNRPRNLNFSQKRDWSHISLP